jgi:glycosyltransferase involved in cell wall biosynthesis
LKQAAIAMVICGLSENWLGGVNYYRNLIFAFNDSPNDTLVLHILTDNAKYFSDLKPSNRIVIHVLPMLKNRSIAWVARKALLVLFKRDIALISLLRRIDIRAVVFCHVPGASASGIRCIPWVPDFQSCQYPELFSAAAASAEHRQVQKWLRDSDALIVSSEAAKADAIQFYAAASENLYVLNFAPRLNANELIDVNLRNDVLSRYEIKQPYFHLPNQYWKHKNHRLVLLALQCLREQGHTLPLIVSTGKQEDTRDPSYFASFEALRQRLGLVENYRVFGVVPRQDMLVLMANCAAVINPSLFEGWNTGVEEAKALGKPLVVSDIPVHREQVNNVEDAAVFNPQDPVELAAVMRAHQLRSSWVGDHSPKPQSSIYEAFLIQYSDLLHSFAAPQKFTP